MIQQNWLNFVWRDVIGIALGLYAVNAAISGQLKTYGRGGGSLTWARLTPLWSRILAAVVGLGVLAIVTYDLLHKFQLVP
jgi:hypothetical protein